MALEAADDEDASKTIPHPDDNSCACVDGVGAFIVEDGGTVVGTLVGRRWCSRHAHLKVRIGYQKWNRLFGVLFCLLRVRLWLPSKQIIYKLNKKLYTKYINLLLNICVHTIIVFGYRMSASGHSVNNLFTKIIIKFIMNSSVYYQIFLCIR